MGYCCVFLQFLYCREDQSSAIWSELSLFIAEIEKCTFLVQFGFFEKKSRHINMLSIHIHIFPYFCTNKVNFPESELEWNLELILSCCGEWGEKPWLLAAAYCSCTRT